MNNSDFKVSLLKRTFNFFASIKLFFITSMLVSAHFYIAVMGIKAGVDPEFKKLNNYILVDWIKDCGLDHKIILIWLFIAFILLGILGLNIFARLLKEVSLLKRVWIQKKHNQNGLRLFFKKISVFFIHFSFVLMLLIHLISSVSGLKFRVPDISKGAVLSHEELPYELRCVDIKKADKKYLKPNIHLESLEKDNPVSFVIPGWNQGYYYNVSAGYVKRKVIRSGHEKIIKKIGLKLVVSNLNVFWLLIAASIVCLTGLAGHIIFRSGSGDEL